MEPMPYSMAILDYDMTEQTKNGLGTSMNVPEQKEMISSNGKKMTPNIIHKKAMFRNIH